MNPAGRNVRTLGVMFAVAGLLGLLFSVVVPPIARAASNHRVEIDLGNGFTTDPHGTVVDTSRLAPGRTVSGTFGVRSDYAGDSDLDLKFVDVSAHNGCPPAAVASDPCPQGPGNLRDELVFDVAVGDSRDGPFTSAWSGYAAELENDVSIPGTVHEFQPRWVRLTATLPRSADNETENDQFGFGLRVTLTSSSGAEGLTVEKEPPRTGRLALAVTGASIALLGVAAMALLACGVIALLTGRSSRGRRRSTASDEAEHRTE
jgi:hypothetical protein